MSWPGTAARPPIRGAALATGVALLILVALGVWQLRRLAWKTALLDQIAAAEQAPPVPLTDATPKLFTRVRVTGTWEPKRALYGAEVRGLRLGAQAVQLLDRPDRAPVAIVLGWVPTDASAPPPATGDADVTGYVRLPEEPGWLSASDDTEGRHFYTLNPATIGATLGASRVAPFTLVALGPEVTAGGPQPATALPRPTNNHLQYAFTWFGLAGALAAVFVSWVLRRTAPA